ncbi:MAG: DUF4236 domain-containing protein [Pseudomonadota bacterium]
MALRFRRSVKLAPGLRLNFSGSGMSLTAGPRGASVSFGSRGTFLNSGIPGTGLYSGSRLGAAPSRPAAQPGKVSVSATARVEDDGTVSFLDANGEPLNDYLTNLAKRQQGAKIRELLEQASDRINDETDGLARIQCHTPSPSETPRYSPTDFPEPQPKSPLLKRVGFIARIFGVREQIEAENAEAKRQYESDLAGWKTAKAVFEAKQLDETRRFDERLRTDTDFMHELFAESLSSIIWPRETLVSFQIDNAGRSISIDVDLPEIEDLQCKTAAVPARGYKLTLKDVKGKALDSLYVQHIHGVGFRIVGEAFASLPSVMDVTLSGFTQRNNLTTGHVVDTYIYSVRITRSAWTKINFANLDAIDVVAAFERFEVRRKFAKNGSLAAITPFDTP